MFSCFGNWRRLVAVGWAWVAFVALIAGRADAQTAHRYAVEWTTAEGAQSCLQQTELISAVAKLVSAEQLTQPEQADRVILGRGEHPGSWRATLTVVDAAGNPLGEREIQSDAPSCNELSASVALAIALIIDPDRIPAPAAAFEEPPASAPPVPESSSRLSIDSRPPPRRAVKGGAVLLSGVLPAVAIGAQLEFWQPLVRTNSLRFALAYFGAQTIEVSGRPEVSVKLYLVTARAAYCPQLGNHRKVSVFACAGIESGLMVARGQGGGYDNTPARALFALDGALTVDWALVGPWATSLTGGAALAPFRPQFSYRTAAEPIDVYRRGVLEGRLEIGLSYRF